MQQTDFFHKTIDPRAILRTQVVRGALSLYFREDHPQRLMILPLQAFQGKTLLTLIESDYPRVRRWCFQVRETPRQERERHLI